MKILLYLLIGVDQFNHILFARMTEQSLSLSYGQLNRENKKLLSRYLHFCKTNLAKPYMEQFQQWQINALFDGNIDQDFKQDYKFGFFEEILINDYDLIDKYYKSDNVLITRPFIGKTKILAFCCFGSQQYNSGGYPMYFPDDRCDYMCGFRPTTSDTNYVRYHAHEQDGYLTVDMALSSNPDIIANLETATFSFIPDGSITEICFEGGRCQPTKIFIAEMTRLLCEGGVMTHRPNSKNPNDSFAVKKNGKLSFAYCEDEHMGLPDFFMWKMFKKLI